jgi:phage virion morphogenesis protein
MLALQKRIGRRIQSATKRRITRQVSPDGVKWAPRKDQTGIRGKMLQGFADAGLLRVMPSAHGVRVGYTGAIAALARVHHDGLVDTIEPHGAQVKYAPRKLIGLTEQDRSEILSDIVKAISKQ